MRGRGGHARLRRPPGPGPGTSAGLVVLLFILPGCAAAITAGGASGNGAVGGRIHPVVLHAHLQPQGSVRPSSSTSFYTQEGVTVSQWDGSASRGVLPTIQTTVRLVTSPVSTGYELNGLSDAGDWYQLVVADNWPGCANGFEEVTEVWSNLGSSGPVTCDPTLSLRAGDLLTFNLSFASSTSVCLTIVDQTTARSHASCNSPPDSGGTGFESLGGTADSNGYFTGPMTEVVNTTASACPDYAKLPTVAYSFLAPAWVSQYTPWADEFEFGGSGTYCFGNSPGVETTGGADPSTYYFDNAAGSGFGSRWGAAQNDSVRVPGSTFRYETDPVRLLTVSASASVQLLPVGGSTTVSASVAGGVAPYSALWSVNGVWSANRTLSWSWNATSTGTTTFVAYGVDRQGDVVGPSNTVSVYVPGPLSVSRIFTSPSANSVDVGQTLTLSVSASGGIAPYTFNWSGLPTGCVASNTSVISCLPTTAGTFVVDLTLTDSNRTTVGSPSLVYDVVADPVASFTVSARAVEVGLTLTVTATASGGAGTLRYAWSGLPPGCSGSSASLQCSPTGAGQFDVDLTVSDANGFVVRPAAITVTVDPPVAVTVSAAHDLIDVQQAVRISATVTGGGGGYTFFWVGLPPGCMAVNASTLLCAPSASGPAVVTVAVTDGLGGSAESVPIDLSVSPALVVSLLANPSPVPAGTAVNITAVVTGGSGGETFAWSSLPSGCPAVQGPTILCAPDSVGTSGIQVVVTDAAGQSVVANLTLTVTGGGGPLLPSGEVGLLVVGGIIGATVAGGLFVVYRRRTRVA